MPKKFKNVVMNYWVICSTDKGLSISEVCFLDLEERFQNGPSTTTVHMKRRLIFNFIIPVSIFFKMDLSYQDKKNHFDISNKRKGARAKNQDPWIFK